MDTLTDLYPEEVELRVEEITQIEKHDVVEADWLRLQLFRDVLATIAAGVDDPDLLAQVALVADGDENSDATEDTDGDVR
jgi:hypothetical protein